METEVKSAIAIEAKILVKEIRKKSRKPGLTNKMTISGQVISVGDIITVKRPDALYFRNENEIKLIVNGQEIQIQQTDFRRMSYEVLECTSKLV